MRDERQGVDFFAIGLRVQRRVALKVCLQAGRAGEGQLQVRFSAVGRDAVWSYSLRAPLLSCDGLVGAQHQISVDDHAQG